ncbi:murein biosynthesis integral membrane protein MurJ, partial [Nostocoides jenkinsii]|uniref:murein biosynthesis integral membrane protein MurJ n=1 Tax=Nostocoides jenkinsii TaxID=330834 RepID=UPI0022862F54
MTDADPQVAGHARTIAILTAAARLAGFARTLVFAATVGATALGSVYQSTNTVPNVVYEIAAGGILAAATVPLLAGRAAAGDRESASRIASGLVGWVLLVLAPLSLLVAILARPVASALLDEETLGERAVDQGATMLLVFAPQVLLYGLGIVLSGVLQAHRRFAAAAAAPLISSLVVIATYAAYGLLATDPADPWAGMLHLLAWGTTAGVAAMLLTLLPSLRGLGVRIRPTLRFPPGVAARAGRLAGAGLLALLAQQVCVLAVVWLSNHRGGAGVLITYQYAQALYLLPYAVLAVPLATAAFPVIAAAGELGDGATGDGAAVVSRTLRGIAVVAVAGATALVTAAPQLGQVFAALDRSSTSGAAASATAVGDLPVALTALTPGLVGFALSALLVRALYARGPARRAALAV